MKVTLRGTQSGIEASALLAALRGAAPEPPPVPEAPPMPSILFDEDDGKLRQRVVGVDRLTRGSTVTIGFSAARADRILDRTKLDRRIQGTLTHRISYAVSFDGGATFAREKPLAARRAGVFEATQAIPADAVSVLLYAHVKAILVAGDGHEIELSDAYDNPGGAFTNYVFEVRSPPR